MDRTNVAPSPHFAALLMIANGRARSKRFSFVSRKNCRGRSQGTGDWHQIMKARSVNANLPP
jgi:hypothetical protein